MILFGLVDNSQPTAYQPFETGFTQVTSNGGFLFSFCKKAAFFLLGTSPNVSGFFRGLFSRFQSFSVKSFRNEKDAGLSRSPDFAPHKKGRALFLGPGRVPVEKNPLQ